MSDARTLTLTQQTTDVGRYRSDDGRFEIIDETPDGSDHGVWRTYRIFRHGQHVERIDAHDSLEEARYALEVRLSTACYSGSWTWHVETIDDVEAEDGEQEAWDDPLDDDVEPLEPGYTIAIPGRAWEAAIENSSILDAAKYVGTDSPDLPSARDLEDALASPKVRRAGRGWSYSIVATGGALAILRDHLADLRDASFGWDGEDAPRDRAAFEVVIDRIDEALEVTP